MSASLVKNNFDEIQDRRAAGETWKAIASWLFGDADECLSKSVRTNFVREMKRRTDPTALSAAEWVEAHKSEIGRLLRSGKSWFEICRTLTCPVPFDTPKGLTFVVKAYQNIAGADYRKTGAKKLTKTPKDQVTPHVLVPSSASVEVKQDATPSDGETLDAPAKNPASISDTEVDQPEQNQSELSLSGLELLKKQMAENPNPMPGLLPGEKMSPKRYVAFLTYASRKWHEVEHNIPEYDPETTIAQYDSEIKKLSLACKKLHVQVTSGLVLESDSERTIEHLGEMQAQLSELKAVRAWRCPNPKGLFVEISTMATVALDKGVFRVCDSDTENAIELRGADRPAGEYPNPVYLIENLTDEETLEIKTAHEQDPFERGMTAKRRIGEALCVRKIANRDLILDPERYPHLNVRLEGADFPSPWLFPLAFIPIELRNAVVGFTLPLVPAEAKRTMEFYQPSYYFSTKEQALAQSIAQQDRLAEARKIEQQASEAAKTKEQSDIEASNAEQSSRENEAE